MATKKTKPTEEVVVPTEEVVVPTEPVYSGNNTRAFRQ